MHKGALDWTPYFTCDEPEWVFRPDEPWAWDIDILLQQRPDSRPGDEAGNALHWQLTGMANYAGRYINVEGYLTVMLVNPTFEQAREIADASPAPVWIIAAEYTYNALLRAQIEAPVAIANWIRDNPDSPVLYRGSGTRESENQLAIRLIGSGIPKFLDSIDFPDFVRFDYLPPLDASLAHEIPRRPNTAWESDGVVIRSARESYPIGTTRLQITASHNAPGMWLNIPRNALGVEKYVDGEWWDLSGEFGMLGHPVVSNLQAGEESTVWVDIFTPETLGPGLYRAILHGNDRVVLSPSSDTSQGREIAGWGVGRLVTLEFTVTEDAELLPPPP
jgi:hypothetical protein